VLDNACDFKALKKLNSFGAGSVIDENELRIGGEPFHQMLKAILDQVSILINGNNDAEHVR